MFRFTIRDVLWLTVVVGLSVAWLSERHARQVTRSHAEALRMVITRAREDYESVLADLTSGTEKAGVSLTDWEMANKPIP